MGPTDKTVIVGGGYAGLVTAARLAHRYGAARMKRRPVALIAFEVRFRKRVRWHENLMSAAKPPSRNLNLQHFPDGLGVSHYQAEATAIDRNDRLVKLDRGAPLAVEYENLVIATGSTADMRNARGVAQYAYLMTHDD